VRGLSTEVREATDYTFRILSGFYLPRRTVVSVTDKRQIRLTHLHEEVHRRISMNSSLGPVAILAGTYAASGQNRE
jgi:hypothetical protein